MFVLKISGMQLIFMSNFRFYKNVKLYFIYQKNFIEIDIIVYFSIGFTESA